ncbi:MAG: SGNH/GDSL hydrolase family protein [Deltaproteobacteria bacterium]|nr:SGNH/GDSL hydrolase family protein [Deltaproteobacteria bacterium]
MKNLRKALFEWCAVAAVSFILVEIILRVAFPFQEGRRTRYSQNLPGLKQEIEYHVYPFGFRSQSLNSRLKGKRTIRILCLGASTTDQPTQSNEDMWSSQLEKRLKDAFASQKINVEVAAFGYGKGGQTLWQRVLWAQHELLSFSPDVVILLEGINDLAWNGGPHYAYSRAQKLREVAAMGPVSVEESWKTHCGRLSQVCAYGRYLLGQWKLKRSLKNRSTVEWHSDHLPELRKQYAALPYVQTLRRHPDPIDEFSDGMDHLLGFLRRNHIETVVMGQPTLWKPQLTNDEKDVLWFYVNTPQGGVRPSPEWLAREMSRYNLQQAQLAQRWEATYIPLDSLIPETLDYFFDDCHFTDKGSYQVADAIFPYVFPLVKKAADRMD